MTPGRGPRSAEILRLRASLHADIRGFFAERGVLEVDTPALSTAGVSDPALASITARVAALGGEHYLHTSPELAMKRLIAAGSGDIYQLCRVFRDGELGRWHEPEFLLLEWYRLGWDEHALMDEVAALLKRLLRTRAASMAAERLTYAEAFARHVGVDPHRRDATTRDELLAALRRHGVDAPAGLDYDALLDLALTAIVTPAFAEDALTFLHDYPASQAALAMLKPTTPPVAARFEVFAGPIELGNGFHELTDATEQRRRFESDLTRRHAAGQPTPPLDEDFLAALATGLPPCAGVAIGVDRVIAVAAGAERLADVVPLAHGLERN